MEIYLNKLIPVIFLPLGFAILLIFFGLLFKRWSSILIAFTMLIINSLPLVGNLMIRASEGWSERINANSVPQANAIVVLSGGRIVAPGASGVSEWADADRFYGGVELFHAGKAPILVFTGGWIPWEPKAKPEGEILIKYAEALGVPLINMRSTAAVVNTIGEAQAVGELLTKITKNNHPGGQVKILLVTSAFHMLRAKKLFELEGMQVIPFPVDFKVSASHDLNILDFLPSTSALGMTEMALREFYGRLFYWIIRTCTAG